MSKATSKKNLLFQNFNFPCKRSFLLLQKPGLIELQNEKRKKQTKKREETVKDTDEVVAIDINDVGVDSARNNETLLISDEMKIKVRDIDIQTDLYTSYYNQIKSDCELSTATGISNFEIFHVIVSNVKKLYNNAKNKLSVEEKVMLTFIKLKQNICFFGHFIQLLFCKNLSKDFYT